ncbi:MAG: Bax inhibitor-1/YccA family protein [Phycisphaerales bacterium]
MRSSNPMLNAGAFEGAGRFGNFEVGARADVMTIQGAVNASMVLMGVCIATAVAVWSFLQPAAGQASALLYPVFLGGAVAGLVLTMVCYFKPTLAPYLGWLVAIAEGCIAGGASVFWTMYVERSAAARAGGGVASALGTGLVLQATLLTAGIAVSLLIAYKTRLIRATENFKLGVFAATGGLVLVTIGSLVLSMFGVRVPYIWDSGPIGIAFAGFVVVLAALNLVLDFDFIEQGAQNQLPRHMEWYAAIGLLVTLVWLYISILRLLAKLQDRR